jgi:peptide/nickel transport system permease protein
VATHLILPTVTLALGEIGQYVFISRAAVADVMDADHVLTARAIGLRPLAVRRRHIVPSARLPIVTQIALNLGFVLGGAITVEALFSWPGLGLATLNAIQAKDFPMLQGLYLVTAVMVIVCNLAADMLYGRLDPRVRSE